MRFFLVAVMVALINGSFAAQTLYVSPTGSDENTGSSLDQALATCSAAVQRIASLLKQRQLPAGGVTVEFAAGCYSYNDSTACCLTSKCSGVAFEGTEASPIVFRGSSATEVLFDGTVKLDSSQLAPVTNTSMRALLNPKARDHILQMPLPGGAPSQLEWNGQPLTPSIYPNDGLAYVQKVYEEGAVYCQGRTKVCARGGCGE